MRLPVATYRLQFGDDLGFEDARRLLPYLDDLGVSDVYASPLLAACPGTSGYHVTDPTRLDPSLGDRAEFDRLTDQLRERGMGLLLDIVPNHMSATSENAWWADVLRRGRHSAYASFFDVDWERCDGRVLLPVLDGSPGELASRGELAVGVEGGEPVVRYHEHVFPVDPATVAGAEDVAELLHRQHYALAHWREAAESVNYRRFFDISALVGLRQEDAAVFEATHAFVLELVTEGRVTGLRVDHVDGLRDPLAYLERLRAAVGDEVPIFVEKILGEGERLPGDWPVQGTTGYEFAAALNDVFVDPDGWRELRAVAAERGGSDEPFEAVAAEKKRLVMEELFSGQIRRVVERVRRILGRRAPPEAALARALVEVTAWLPVYRTYVRGPSVSAPDRRVLDRAFRRAKRSLGGDARDALEPLRSVFLAKRLTPRALDAVMTWQQLTGAVAAKGVEDTALYDDAVLVSRNDVGSDPGAAPVGAEGFHRLQGGRSGLSATSTHDSKRSEDVRARLDVLSEIPDEWRRTLARLDRAAAPLGEDADGGPAPDRDALLALWQDVAGAWPLDDAELRGFPDRVACAALKAAREAKVRTSWLDPDERYEGALDRFVRRVFGDEGNEVRAELERLRERIERAGAAASLAQVVLKAAAPGVPDLYRGAERWYLRLVDPDNRAPVDHHGLARELAELPAVSPRAVAELLREWRDGRVKLHVTRAALGVRRRDPELFERGSYTPLRAAGERSEHVVASARRLRARWAVAVVPRTTMRLRRGGFPVGARVWGDGAITLPARAPTAWTDALTGAELTSEDRSLALRDVFRTLPAALLVPRTTDGGR